MADKAEQFKKANAEEKPTQEREVDGKKEYLDEVTNEWVGKNELKKREKARKKEKDAAEKAAKKKAEPKPAAKAKAAVEDEELDPSKYTDNRKAFLEGLRKDGKNPYPHKFNRDFTVPQFIEKFGQVKIENGEFLEDQKVAVTGRVMNLRPSGAKLIFIDLCEDGGKIQVFATAQNYEGDFELVGRTVKRGDIVGINGVPGKTKTGELSIRPTNI